MEIRARGGGVGGQALVWGERDMEIVVKYGEMQGEMSP